MSSKIVGWLVRAWDGRKKSETEEKNSEIYLKKGNPVFLPYKASLSHRDMYCSM